jgi:hypothetical protein
VVIAQLPEVRKTGTCGKPGRTKKVSAREPYGRHSFGSLPDRPPLFAESELPTAVRGKTVLSSQASTVALEVEPACNHTTGLKAR